MTRRCAVPLLTCMWFVAAAPRAAGADSFLTSVGVKPVDPAALRDDLVELFDASDPFEHYVIVAQQRQSRAGARRMADFFALHERADPDNPLRVLDAGVADAAAAAALDSRRYARSAQGRLARAVSMSSDARLHLVAAIALAEADSVTTGSGGWTRLTGGKRAAIAVLESACTLNRSQRHRGFDNTWNSLRAYMQHYAGYRSFTAKTYDCGAPVRAPEGATDDATELPSGPIIEYWDNGSKKSEATRVDGKLEGVARSWSERGQLLSETHYRHNQKDGIEARWYHNGKRNVMWTWVDGQLTGPAASWHPDGAKDSEGSYLRHRKVGAWTTWHPNGTKASYTEYEDNKESGVVRTWYESGQLRLEATNKNGAKHGLQRTWYESGQLLSEGEFVLDRPEGEHVVWHPNGQIWRRDQFRDGHQEGLQTSWYDNGQMETQGRAEHGSHHGRWRGWYRDGSPRYEGEHAHGRKVGTWTMWSQDGTVTTEYFAPRGKM